MNSQSQPSSSTPGDDRLSFELAAAQRAAARADAVGMQNEARGHPADRRRFPRFSLEPMYAPISARTLDSESFDNEGHAYDISEGGCRFELDRPIEPGTGIVLQITLPTMHSSQLGPGRAVFVFANVVWIEDEDQPGPVKMACVFSRFARVGDRERLLKELRTGRYRAAA